MAQKVLAVGGLIVNDREGWGETNATVVSYLEGGKGLPRGRAQMADRYGKWPMFGSLRRLDQSLNLTTLLLNASDATRKGLRDDLYEELNPETETPIRLTAADDIPPEGLLCAFGPWDFQVQDDLSYWTAYDILGDGRASPIEIDLVGAVIFEDGLVSGQNALVMARVTTNYLYNPSFENNDTSSWTFSQGGAGGSIAASSADAYKGTYSCLMTTGNAYVVAINDNGMTLGINEVVTITGYVKTSTVSRFLVRVRDTTNNLTRASSSYHSGSGNWERLEARWGNNTGAPVTIQAQIYADGPDAGLTAYFDCIQMEKSSVPTRYCDGSLGRGHTWSGDPNASTSSRSGVVARLNDDVSLISGQATLTMRILAQMQCDSIDFPRGSGRRFIFSYENGGSGVIALSYMSTTQKIQLHINGTNLNEVFWPFEAGDWLDIVVTIDFTNDSYKLYVNGAFKNEKTNSLSAPTLDRWYIGGSWDAASGMHIAEYQVWDRVLSADEVSALYTNQAAAGRCRYLDVICEASEPLRERGYTSDRGVVSMLAVDDDVRWRSRDGDVDYWRIYEASATKTVTVTSDDDVYPILRITPKSGKTGGGSSYGYRRFVSIAWRCLNSATTYPVCITLDTSTLNGAGKVQGDLDDLRVYVNGVERDRWLDSTTPAASTKIWVNFNFDADVPMTLKTAIGAGDDPDEIEVNESINALPSAGLVLIDSEVFTYDGKNTSSRKLLNVERAAKGTTAAGHTVSDNVEWLQYDVQLFYGDATLTAPTVDADYKPAFELDGSSNTTWEYDGTGNGFGEDDGLRAGQWVEEGEYGANTFYHGNREADADPWTSVGLRYAEYAAGFTMLCYVHNPCGITAANFTDGENYTSYWNFWHHIVSRSTGGWTAEYQIPIPTTYYSWTAWTRNETLSTGATHVGLRIQKMCPMYYSDLQCEAVTLTLNSSNTPNVTVHGELSDPYGFAFTLTNSTTGDAIEIAAHIDLDETLEIDTDNKTVVLLDDNSNQLQALTLTGGPRRDWFKLQPGSNVLTYAETGAVELEIDIYWERRYWE